MLDLQPGDDVLDVACGSGVFLQRYASHVHHMAGVDHSEIQIKMARKRNRDRIAAGTAEIVQGDSAALPWGEGLFSAVTCNSLGCFAEPLQSLQEMHRVLRPGGRMVLSTEFYPEDQAARRVGQKWGLPTWTEAELRKMLDQVGFANVSVSRDKTTMFTTATKEHAGADRSDQPQGAAEDLQGVDRRPATPRGSTGRR